MIGGTNLLDSFVSKSWWMVKLGIMECEGLEEK